MPRQVSRVGESLLSRVIFVLTLVLALLKSPEAEAGCINGVYCAAPSIVSLSSPTPNGTYNQGSSVLVAGVAAGNIVLDAVGNEHYFWIDKVEIYVDGALKGVATLGASGATDVDFPTREFSFTLSGLTSGAHNIGIKPYDTGSNTNGGSGQARVIPITVVANDAPIVQVSAAVVQAISPGRVTLTATASDTIGGIDYVEFLANGSTISGRYGAPPYSLDWNNVGAGTYSVTARALDWLGLATMSAPVTVIISPPNIAPQVTLSTSGAVTTAPGRITLSATASDPDGSVASVQYFVNGNARSGILSTPPYTYSWTGVAAGNYSIIARATDDKGATKDSTVYNFTVAPAANAAPQVSLSASSPDTVAPGGVTLTVNATDSDGSISSVWILKDGTQVGSPSSLPYAYTASGLVAGVHRFIAVARDNAGTESTSAAYVLTVSAAANASPTVSLSTSGAVTTVPGRITLSASASDPDGIIARVRYYKNGVELVNLSTPPYTFAWTNVSADTYAIQAVAEDNLGATGYSSTYNFIVTEPVTNIPPTVRLVSPATGTVIDSSIPGTISMSATASDSDGTIKNVQFFINGTAVATTAPPYSAIFNVSSAGTYIVKAVATDDDDASASSATATVTILPSNPATGPAVSTENGYPGAIEGQASVSVLGRAQANIPLVIPPGVANFAPKISLNYDSGQSNGVLGVGWNIGGLSSITRCNRDIAHDGISAAVDMTANDRFCLDGQRLILVSGTYGGNGSEYRLEQDTYAKITAMGEVGGGPEHFITRLRDGTQILFDKQFILSGHTAPSLWLPTRVSDPRENYYLVKYYTPPGGVPLVQQILYTGNSSSGAVGSNLIVFIYETSRSDIEVSYFAGAMSKVSHRLAKILVSALQTGSGSSTPFKSYVFGYQYSEGTLRSRLNTVSECDMAATPSCKPATAVTWESTAGTKGTRINYPGFTEQFGALPEELEERVRSYWVDLNGDGVPEHCVQVGHYGADLETFAWSKLYCGMTQPNGAAPVAINVGNFDPPAYPLEFLDFNGDGLTDICQGSRCSLTGPSKPAESHIGAPGPYAAGDISFFRDMNGDGRVDFCAMRNGGVSSNPYRMTCFLYSGTAWGAAQDLGIIPTAVCGSSMCDTLRYSWAMFTPDNIPSFCRLDDSSMRCRKWTPSGFGPEMSIGPINIGDRDGRAWADVNGDGLDDFCRVIPEAPITQQGNDQGKGKIECTLATGTGFGITVSSATIDIGKGSLAPSDTYRSWLDVNGDGKSDFCRSLYAGGAVCEHSIGGAFSGTTSFTYADATRLVDATGDGKVDDCTLAASDNADVNFCVATVMMPTDIVLSIKDGRGASSTFEYSYLLDPQVYTRGTGSVFPVTDVLLPDHIVAALKLTDGNGAERKHIYKFEAARVDQQGRGALGFAAMTRNDASGLTIRSEFLQNFPYTGLVNRVLTKSGNVTVSDITMQFSATSAAPYKIHQVSSISKTFNPDGSFLNWVETLSPLANIDAYGNVGSLSTVWKDANGTADGFSHSLAVGYLNDTTKWILGQPSTIALTSKAPGRADSVRSETKSYFTSNPGLGLVKQDIVEPDNGNLGITDLRLLTEYTYDAFGNVKTQSVSGANIDARTEVSYGYDVSGRGPVSITNALGHKEIITYDWRFGLRSSVADANDLKTLWTYDTFGRVLTQTNPDNTVTTRTYNRCVSCVSYSAYSETRRTTVPLTGAVVEPPIREYFDTLGRSIMVVKPGFSGKEVLHRRQYDKLGRLNTEYTPYFAGGTPSGSTSYGYDVLDRISLVTMPDNTTVKTSYAGRKITITNHKGIKSATTRNSQDKVVSVVDAEGTTDSSTTTYEYDNWRNEVKRTDAAGNITNREFDLRGRLRKLVDPDLGTWTYTVDNLGQRLTQKDAKLQQTAYSYDLLGRIKRRLEPDQDSKWFYEANAAGQICEMAVGKLCESTSTNGYFRRFTYDNLGRQERSTEHIDADYVTSYTYDAAGRLSTQTSPVVAGFTAPFAVKYNYTALGELQSVSNNSTGAVMWTKTSANAAGSLTAEKFGNSIIGIRTYDPLSDRLITLQSGTAAAPFGMQNHVYLYDVLGRLEVKEERQPAVNTVDAFDYDALDRLKTATIKNSAGQTTSTFMTYNAIGNIVARTGLGSYSYPTAGTNRPHAVTRISGTIDGVTAPSYNYDDNGNLSSGGQFTVSWMSFNMPSAISKATASLASGKSISSFLYGANHQRVKQAWTDTARTITTFYVDGGNFEKEFDSQTGLTQYKHYLQVDGRQIAIQTRMSNGTENVRYMHADRLGSINVVTDSSGTAMERLAFDAWGDRRNATTAAADPTNLIQPNSSDRGFTGHEGLDLGNMGLVHMNARVYHPALGRFLSPDTFIPDRFRTQDLNRYTYVNNRPTEAVDPTGHQLLYVEQVPGQRISVLGGWGVVCVGEACQNEILTQQMLVQRNSALNMPTTRLVKPISREKVGALARKSLNQMAASLLKYTDIGQNVLNAVTLIASVSGDDAQSEEGEGTDSAGGTNSEGAKDGEKSGSKDGAKDPAKPGREKDVPDRGEPGEVKEGERRTREYGADGKPLRDYDKPHQGYDRPHVHEWPGGQREHPGRDYSPWPKQ
jgi:RHS repeat-associated protein